jgi:hypothetical protein
MVRARRADADQPRRLGGGRELDRARRRVDGEQLRALAGERAGSPSAASSRAGPPKRGMPAVRSFANATASSITAIVRR